MRGSLRSRFQVSGFRFRGTRNPASPSPETQNLKPETRPTQEGA
jgi:hypothetical protein